MQERRQIILQKLEIEGKVRVAELSKQLNCSEVTIRNDIKNMHEEGLLMRTHGGAIRIEKEPVRKYNAESIYRNVEQKKKIAACAYEFIKDRDTIMMDDASNTFYLALHIKEHPEKRVVVVTNSLLIGNELAGLEHVDLYMVGGYVGGHLSAILGESAINYIEQFHVDKAFIGVHGINFDVGVTSIAEPQRQVKKAIVKAASKVYVLADHSKFGGGYLSVVCPISEIHKIITDDEVSVKHIKQAEVHQVPLLIAK